MTDKPLVSVVIPTFNREQTIARALNSVLSQSYSEIEVIIVDDCSTDHTEKIVNSISDSRVKYIRNKENKGPSGARNVGILASSGSFIAFQDSDDEWVSEKVSIQMELFEHNSKLGMVYCAYEYHLEGIQYKVPSNQYRFDELYGNIFQTLIENNKVGTPCMLIKRSCLDAVGLFDERLRALEDWDLALRISKEYEVGYVDQTLVRAFFSNDNSVNFNNTSLLEAEIQIVNKYLGVVDDKLRFKNLLRDIILRIINIPNEQRTLYLDQLIPNIIGSSLEYELIVAEINRTNKFKDNYDIALKLLENSDFSNDIKNFLQNSNINLVAVYGVGHIGKVLIRMLKEADINIKYAIDQNISTIGELKVITCKDIHDDVDLIIISLPKTNFSVKNELERYCRCKIMFLEELL